MGNKLILLCVLLSVQVTTFAQQIKLTGKVKDSHGDLLIGVTVKVVGQQIGTVTDFDGVYTLEVDPESKLEFSYIGMKKRFFDVKGRTTLNVVLHEDSELIEEVVVVGYGTMKKSDLSGSVASIKSEDLTVGNPSDLAQGLNGRIAGVNVMQNDGSPGGGMSINIRGANSFTTSSQPLYILDGIPFESSSIPSSDANVGNIQQDNPLSMINPNDIESIEVLKDASATAIYGSRGANGVVIITTKKGSAGRDIIEYSASFSVSQVARKLNYLGAYDYANYMREQVSNSNFYDGQNMNLPYGGTWNSEGKYTPAPEDFLNPGIYTDPTGTFTDQVGVADWQNEIFQNAIKHEHNLRLSGGSDKGTYMISGNYLNQEGVVKNSGFERYTLRTNLTRNLRPWLRVGTNITFTNSETAIAKSNSTSSSILRAALIYPTTYDPVISEREVSDELSWLSSNPLSFINNAKDDLTSININTSSFVEASLLKSLKFRQNIGISYATKSRSSYYDRNTREGMNVDGLAGQGDNQMTRYVFESLLTWNKSFNRNRHRINVLGGFMAEKSIFRSKSMAATNFPNDFTLDYDMSAGLVQKKLKSGYGESSLFSYILRGNYTLFNRFIFTGTYRRDGSSKFIEDNKFANFYSGAFAYRLSEESFMKNVDFISNLKLRTSYGETGNQGINSYMTFTRMGVSNYPFGGNGLVSGGAVSGNLTSSDLKWETTRQFDLGVDIGLFRELVTLTADYYVKNTIDLLQTVVIPSSTGYEAMLINSGIVMNKGVELSLGLNNIFRDSKWDFTVTGNIAFNKNEISGLASDQFAPRLTAGLENVFIQRNGMPIGAIYGYVENGFYDNIAEVKADPQYKNLSDKEALKKVGEVKYLDLDGQVGTTSGDMTIIGNTNPNFTYGLNLALSRGPFRLSAFFQGTQGNDIFNANLLDQDMAKNKNISEEAYCTRWTPDNYENAKWPKPTNESTRNMLISDRFVEDGSFFKLKNVNFEYTFRPKIQTFISGVVVYLNATNLFTLTNYSGYDPEVNSFGSDASRRGVDFYAYPSSRTYTIGTKINF